MNDSFKDPVEDTGLQRARAALSQLAERPSKPSKAAQIRQLLPEIEAAQAAGASRQEIVEALRRSGVDVSLKTFATALARARRKRAKKSENAERLLQKDPEEPTKPRRRGGLEMPAPPKTFKWDPHERPRITFGGKDVQEK